MNMIPKNIEKLIQKNQCPQRILLSGSGDNKECALEIASRLQKTPKEILQKKAHSDTILFEDEGKSFKIDWSDAAKKDEQGEYENVRGLIRWAHQKPTVGAYRIVIFENIERLTDVSPHACLKLIEEPPQKTIFLFTTRNHHHKQILDTIISRLSLFRIPNQNAVVNSFSKEVVSFFESPWLIPKFNIIESLHKQSKEDKGRTMDRNIFKNFLLEAFEYTSTHEQHKKQKEILFESYNAIEQNINPKLTLERLALKISSKKSEQI